MLLEVVLVEPQVGAALALFGIEAATLGHHVGALALELGEVADRSVVEGDGHAAELPLLAHLLVAPDGGEAEVFEQRPRLLGALDLDLVLLPDLEVALQPHGPLVGQARPPAIGAQAEDLALLAQLVAAVQDPVVLEGRGTPALRLELEQPLAQLVQLHTRKLDLALEVVLAPHSSPRRSSSRATERIPL